MVFLFLRLYQQLFPSIEIPQFLDIMAVLTAVYFQLFAT